MDVSSGDDRAGSVGTTTKLGLEPARRVMGVPPVRRAELGPGCGSFNEAVIFFSACGYASRSTSSTSYVNGGRDGGRSRLGKVPNCQLDGHETDAPDSNKSQGKNMYSWWSSEAFEDTTSMTGKCWFARAKFHASRPPFFPSMRC